MTVNPLLTFESRFQRSRHLTVYVKSLEGHSIATFEVRNTLPFGAKMLPNLLVFNNNLAQW